MSDWSVVARYGSGLEADLAVETLRGQDVPAQARGNDIAGIFGVAFQGASAKGVDVIVPTAMLDDAREILGLEDESGG